MAEPFIAQILVVGFNFAPIDYAFCDGQLQAISQNEALFALIGTTYGGDGITTFGLPNIQERGVVNIGQGPGLSNYDLGQLSGVPTVTLTSGQVPQHNHLFTGHPGTSYDVAPAANGWVGDKSLGGRLFYGGGGPNQTFAPTMTVNTGGSQPHDNMQPYLVMNYCIALFGIFPSRN